MRASSFTWNSIGSILSAGSSFVLLACVTRTCGARESSIFAFAFSSAQLLLTVGKYGVRAYQATDVSKEVRTDTYYVLRVLTCIWMLLLSAVVIAVFGYTGASAGIIIAVCIIKMVDAIEDVFHGFLQLNGRLDLAGKLLSLRNLITMLVFGLLIFSTQNIAVTCWITGIGSVCVCLLLNFRAVKEYGKIHLRVQREELFLLIRACTPLCLGSFLSLYIYNIPKYAIDVYCSEEIQTYYNIIFMPAFCINLLSEFLFKPFLTTLADWWRNGEQRRFLSAVKKILGYIVVVTIVAELGTKMVGTEILSAIYGVDIGPYEQPLLLLMLGGGFGAAVYFLYNVLTSMREQREILKNYTIASVFITCFAFWRIQHGGIMAAAGSYLLTEVVLCVFMIASIKKCTPQNEKEAM